MGRTTTFDPDAALAAALDTFWRRGYGASSIQVLLDAMNLNRGSLYNSFGGKEDLFRSALDLYFARNTSVVIGLLETSPNPVQGIVAVFEWTLIDLPEELRRRGCVLVNTVAELGETDPGLASHAYKLLHGVREALAGALVRARQAGLWRDADADPDAVADVLFQFLVGLRVTSRLGEDRERTRQSVARMLALVGLET